MPHKVVVPPALGRYDSIATLLEGQGCEILRLPAPEAGKPLQWTPQLIGDYFSEADAFIGSFAGLKITREVLEAGKKLKVGASPIIGTENIDVDAATELGIVIGYGAAPENLEGVAESVVMLSAALVKRQPWKWAAVRDGGWRVDDAGHMVKNATIGLIGLGNIGRATAVRFRGWETTLLGFDPYVSQAVADQYGVRMVDKDTLLRESDVVSVMVTLTDETKYLLDAEDFAKMKQGAFVVNTARGACINEKALIAALQSGHLGGAAIDAWEQEPTYADNPLRTMPNVITTGHCVGHSEELHQRIPAAAAENILRGLRGEPPLYTRNPAVLPKWAERLRGMGVEPQFSV
jgi:phosphoglycerate dehydrogenase-like enzyme